MIWSYRNYGSISHWLSLLISSVLFILGIRKYCPEYMVVLDIIRSYSVVHFLVTAIYMMIPISVTYILLICAGDVIDYIVDLIQEGKK